MTRTFLIFLGSLFLLAACGSKGPLTLPPKTSTAAPTAAPAVQPAPATAPADDSTAPGAAR